MTAMDSDAVTPDELQRAAAELGWAQESEVPGVLSSWQKGQSELLIPLDSTRGDYNSLLTRAVRFLAEVDGLRANLALDRVRRLTRSAFDVTRFARESAVEGGIIGWSDGRALFDAAEQSLLAAARSSRQPKKYHGSSSAYLARNFIESSYMGQTEIGSFVVCMMMQPSEKFALRKADEPKEGQPSPSDDSSISGREIVETFRSALTSTRTVLDQFKRSPKLEAFDELVDVGVSAELLRALSTVSAGSSESAITIDFQQAGVEVQPQRFEVTFAAPEAQVLERASRRFLEDREPETGRITGRITLLERPKPGEAGVVRVRVLEGADIANVRIRVESDDYAQVVDAFRDGWHFSAEGRIERDGRYYWMYNAHNLEIVEPQEGTEEDDSTLDSSED